jgi:adenylate kinase
VKNKAAQDKRIKAELERRKKLAQEAAEKGEEPPKSDRKEEEPIDLDAPINVKLDYDSDDEFKEIEIKEKVRAHQKANGSKAEVPEDLINEAIRWRLNQNDCQNRGYVLDGYPLSFEQANSVFVLTPKAPEKKAPAEGEEEAPEEEVDPATLKPVLQTNIYPESVILLNASELFLKRRAKDLEKSNENAKWETPKLIKNLQAYNSKNSMSLFRTFHGEAA